MTDDENEEPLEPIPASERFAALKRLIKWRAAFDKDFDRLMLLVMRSENPKDLKAMLDLEYDLTGACESTAAVADASGLEEP